MAGLSNGGGRDAINPNNLLGLNEYIKAPSRPDRSTVGPGGNTVNRSRINKTHTGYTTKATPAKPGGQPTTG